MVQEPLDWAEPLLEQWEDPLLPVVGPASEAWSYELLPLERALSTPPEFQESVHWELMAPAEEEQWKESDLPW